MALREHSRQSYEVADEVTEPRFLAEPSFYGRFGKRTLDLVISLGLLILLSPIILLLALAVAATTGLPVFYSGVRVGKDGRAFRIWKLRTMVRDADAIVEYWRAKGTDEGVVYFQSYKLRKDPRITTIGRFLRKTSLDELPQLWNVLRGDMSLVGPRPIVEEELEKYGDSRDLLLSVRPGLTGWWQVNGRNDIDYPERAYMELVYASYVSLGRDVSILLRTVPTVARLNGR